MFTIKIYERSGAFVQAVNEINDISFTSQINWGQWEVRVEAAGILPDFSGKIVKIYETKMINTSLIYSGLIGKVTIISDSSKEYTEITAMGLAVVLWNTLFDETGNYVITKNQEVSLTIKNIIDSVSIKYPWMITYTWTSIETTGITANLLFAYNKSIDAITTAAGVTEFSWYVDQDGVFQFHPKIWGIWQTTHIFTVWEDVNSLSVEEDSEEIVNNYVLEYSGGSTYSNSDATSQGLYWIREEKNTNTQIADLATAMASVNSYLAEKKDKKLKIRITVNSKYNIESLKPGDLASVRNFSYNIESLQIQRVTYNRNEATLDLEEYNSLAKEILT